MSRLLGDKEKPIWYGGTESSNHNICDYVRLSCRRSDALTTRLGTMHGLYRI